MVGTTQRLFQVELQPPIAESLGKALCTLRRFLCVFDGFSVAKPGVEEVFFGKIGHFCPNLTSTSFTEQKEENN